MDEDTVHEGLEGIVVGETRLSDIDGEAGELVIGGFPVDELAPNATFEETLYLLWHDRLPNEEELAGLEADLREYRALPDETIASVRAAAERGLPAMDALRMGVASASLARADPAEAEPHDDAKLAVAQIPSVVAAYWRACNGDEPVEPNPNLSHAANFLYMLTGARPDDSEVRGLETYLNAVVDHGFNASTFTARTIVSTESDVLSAVTGAVGALKGPLHGGAPGPVLEMLLHVHDSDDPEGYVRETLEAGERLMGFGHRVYGVRDPRAAVLSEAAESFYEAGDDAFFESAKETERVAVDVLEEYKPDRKLETNVEFYTAVLLYGVGVPRELFSAVFATSRVGGWTAHCLEQLENNRIIRPRSKYVGDADRSWVPIEDR